jgi:Restriction endonuclease
MDKLGADQITKPLLRARWERLQIQPTGLPAKELRQWKRARGYELERLLLDLFALEGLDPSPSYCGQGEQIDGLFRLDHRYLLLEAKWQKAEAAASDIFSFRGKLEGKLIGTIGVFVSVSGFSEDAPDALIWGKEINVILVDRGDVKLALDERYSFAEIMRVKLRQAAQRGRVYYAYQSHLDMHAGG